MWCGVLRHPSWWWTHASLKMKALQSAIHCYTDMLLNVLVLEQKQHSIDLQTLWFQHDRATTHLQEINNILCQMFPANVILQGGDIQCPATSPTMKHLLICLLVTTSCGDTSTRYTSPTLWQLSNCSRKFWEEIAARMVETTQWTVGNAHYKVQYIQKDFCDTIFKK